MENELKTIELTLPYPISANRYWRSFSAGKRVVTVPSPEAKDYKQSVQLIAQAAGIRAPINGRVHIHLQLFPHRPLDWQKRMRLHGASWDDTVQCIDLDNARKVLYDSLKGVAIEDDKWVRSDSGERMEPDGEARVVVTITALQVEQPQVALFEEA